MKPDRAGDTDLWQWPSVATLGAADHLNIGRQQHRLRRQEVTVHQYDVDVVHQSGSVRDLRVVFLPTRRY